MGNQFRQAQLHELHLLYEQNKLRLFHYQKKYMELKRRLERERVLEHFQLVNKREELEKELKMIGDEIALLLERKNQYDQIFHSSTIDGNEKAPISSI